MFPPLHWTMPTHREPLTLETAFDNFLTQLTALASTPFRNTPLEYWILHPQGKIYTQCCTLVATVLLWYLALGGCSRTPQRALRARGAVKPDGTDDDGDGDSTGRASASASTSTSASATGNGALGGHPEPPTCERPRKRTRCMRPSCKGSLPSRAVATADEAAGASGVDSAARSAESTVEWKDFVEDLFQSSTAVGLDRAVNSGGSI